MKRNENIIPLSRDHHFGLLCVWKIRQGLKKNIEFSRVQKYVSHFWEEQLKTHFQEEETILFPYLKDKMSDRIRDEHNEIGVLAQKISGSGDSSDLENFADLLEKHIRFEEREWFPHLENHLSQDDLNEIGKRLEEIHSVESDDYEDEFWKPTIA